MIRRGWIGTTCIVVIFAAAGCDRDGHNMAMLRCQSSDIPPVTAHIAIRPTPGGSTTIVVTYPSLKPLTFRVEDEAPSYYSALEISATADAQGASLYFDRINRIAIETFRTSTASRNIRLERCDGKISAAICKVRLAKRVESPVRDIQDCDDPSKVECESWRLGSTVTSEVHLSCH